MSKTDPSSRSDEHSRPLLTLQISRRFGWMLLVALAVIATLVLLDLQRHREDVTAAAPIPTPAENSPAPTRSRPPMEGVAARNMPNPAPPVQDNSVKIASSTVNIHQEAAPVQVIIPPTPAMEPQADLYPVSVPVEPVDLKTNGPVTLNGAGATFPNPIYAKWFSEFHKLEPNVQINYQAIGSGGGIRQVLAGTVDFGATDIPMTDEELAQTRVKIVHIPTVLGAVVPIYNLPGISATLRFTPEILAGIFLGQITSWNHPWIQSANPRVNLPNQPFIVVHRSDGNGTTYTLTDYLSKVSGEWQSTVGRGTSVKWPIGLGGKGNEGVAGQVRQLQGAIGYVDLIYAVQNNLPYGSVRNSSGTFVKATLDSVTEAAESIPNMPADFRVSITNPPGHGAYPISSYTWLLVPEVARDAQKGKVLAAFLNWMLASGHQAMAQQLGYGPLPGRVASRVWKTITQLR